MFRIRRTPAALLGAALAMSWLTCLASPAQAAAPAQGAVAWPAPQTDISPAARAGLAEAIRHARLHDAAAEQRHICYAAQVQNIGWQAPVCDGAVAGTVGRSLRLETLAILVSGVGGGCAQASVQSIGWQAQKCVGDGEFAIVGTIGRSLAMEALAISVGTGFVCGNAQVENIGWQGQQCGRNGETATLGTTGRNLRMEAVTLVV